MRCPTLALAAVVVAAIGCASVKTTSTVNPAVDLSQYSSWNYATGGDPHHLPALAVVQVEVGRALTKKGYVQDASQPDLLMYVLPSSKQALRAEHFQWGFYDEPGAGDWWWEGGGTITRDVTILSVGVDLVDSQSKQLVWRGIASGAVKDVADVEDRIRRVQSAVAELLRTFPTR